MNITPVTNHREREKGCVVYPVYSRRSEGLSIGINLFPDKKKCLFDCPYCEVFPFSANAEFDLKQMEDDLRYAVASAQKGKIIIRDICFSGNGEPTLSPSFPYALESAEKIRAETAPESKLVVITNGTGLLQPRIFSLLKNAALCVSGSSPTFDIWLKLDAGTDSWYQKINRCALPREKLLEKIKEFTACAGSCAAHSAPVTIQTMLCAINGEKPPKEETAAWEILVRELAANGNIRKVQLYGKARAAPEDPLASLLPEEYLKDRAASLQSIFKEKEITTPIEIYN